MKKRVLLIINCFLLCCTVSFAWILGGNPEIVKNLYFDFTGEHQMVISSVDVDTTVVLLQGEDEIPVDEGIELASDTFVPDSMVPFRIKFDYQSDDRKSLAIRLSLVGITVSDPLLLSKVYISVTPVNDGLMAPNGPRTIYMSLANAVLSSDGNSYTLEIYDEKNRLIIPHIEDGESVLDCYLLLDKEVGCEYQNMWLDIGAFRIE